MTGASKNPEGKADKDEDGDDMTVPCCVTPITFLLNLTRWKDLIGGLLLSTTTTVCLGLVVICYQGVQITEAYDTCPVVSIMTCGIIVFARFMQWRSGQIGAVYRKLEKDQQELKEVRAELDTICKLADDTTKLNDTAGYLNTTAKNMTKLQKQMKSNTDEMFQKVVNLKEQRKEIGESLNKVTNFILDLVQRDDDFKESLQFLFTQLDTLGQYLKNLQKAKSQLSLENERLESLKDNLEDQLKEFDSVKEEIISNDQWANNVFEMGSYLEQRYIQLVELTTNYEQNYIMQVVHQCEFIDGKPGWNDAKVQELCERLPENCPDEMKSNFFSCFQQLQEEVPNGVVDYKAMEKLVKEKIIPYTDPIIKSHNEIDESSSESKSEIFD